MKSPQSWNRREFDVTPNGYFTVLRSSGWFSAARLPAGFRYLFKGAPNPAAKFPTPSESVATGLPPQILPVAEREPWLMRIGFISVAAATITYLALWLISKAP